MHRFSVDIRSIAIYSLDEYLKRPQVAIGKYGNICRINKNGMT